MRKRIKRVKKNSRNNTKSKVKNTTSRGGKRL